MHLDAFKFLGILLFNISILHFHYVMVPLVISKHSKNHERRKYVELLRNITIRLKKIGLYLTLKNLSNSGKCSSPFELVQAKEGEQAGSSFPILIQCKTVQKLVHEAVLGSAKHPSAKGRLNINFGHRKNRTGG